MLKSKMNQEALDGLIALIEVRPEYIQAAFDEIKRKYGSFDAYLEKGIGITPDMRKRLQAQMLEDTTGSKRRGN